MARFYDRSFKNMIVKLICVDKHSTKGTALQFDIPLKTVEKWVSSYNKDIHVFDDDYLSSDKCIEQLKKTISKLEKDNEVLKKTISLLARKE